MPKAKLDSWSKSQRAILEKKKKAFKKEHILPFQMLSYIKSVWKNVFTKRIYCRIQNPTKPVRLNLESRFSSFEAECAEKSQWVHLLVKLHSDNWNGYDVALVLSLNSLTVKPICAYEYVTNWALLIPREKCGSDWMLCKINKKTSAPQANGSFILIDTGIIALEH